MKVLIIAPFASDLPNVSQEVQEVANTLGAKVAQGVMTDEKITNVVRRFGPFDLTIFAGHLGEEGFPRGDGNFLPADRFTMMLGDTRYLFVNACDGVQLVDVIRSRTKAHVITATGAIEDDMALQSMRTFADGVADTGDIRYAFERLKETRQYDFFENRAAVREVKSNTNDSAHSAGLERRVSTLESLVAGLQKSVNDLALIVQGSSDLGLRGLRSNVSDMKDKVDDMHKSLTDMRADMSARRAGDTPEVLQRHATAIVASIFVLLIASLVAQYFQ